MKVYATIDNPRMALADVPAHAARAEKIGFDGLLVPEAVNVPVIDTAPDAVSEPEKVLFLVNVWVPTMIASSHDVYGNANVRVVPVVMPERENSAFVVGSASFTKLNG